MVIVVAVVYLGTFAWLVVVVVAVVVVFVALSVLSRKRDHYIIGSAVEWQAVKFCGLYQLLGRLLVGHSPI